MVSCPSCSARISFLIERSVFFKSSLNVSIWICICSIFRFVSSIRRLISSNWRLIGFMIVCSAFITSWSVMFSLSSLVIKHKGSGSDCQSSISISPCSSSQALILCLIRYTISCVVLLSFSSAIYAIFSKISLSARITNCGFFDGTYIFTSIY